MAYNVQGARPVFLVDDAGNTYSNSVASTSAFSATLAASTNLTSVKGSAGSVLQLDVSNNSGATVYLKFYNKASAPVLGTDVPVLTIPITTASAYIQEFGQYGKRFTTGIAFAVTGLATDADTTAIAAGAKIGITYL